jgi:ribosomal-protein-alanine N-acetyltransferase
MTTDSNSNPPRFRLRPFRPEDMPRLVELDQRCFPPDVAYDSLEMFYHLNGPRTLALLAEPIESGTDPSLLGFVIAHAGSHGRPGQIVTIDVAPEARRRGVGSRLLEVAEELLARHRTTEVRLQVAVDNDGARTFYREHGYSPLGIHPHYYPDGTDAIEMMKRLTAPGTTDSAG